MAPEDISSDALEEQVPKHEKPRTKKFQGWHLPRKTWIRINQWGSEITNFIANYPGIGQDNQFKYLTLPGTDLLDVRYLSSLMPDELQIKFLGFCSDLEEPNENELNLSLSEVMKLPNVHKESKVIPDKFEQVVDVDSKAYHSLKDYAGFDAINIDLCNALLPSGKRQIPSQCDGIKRILDVQMKFRKKPWLFFLTTRAGPNEVNNEDMQKLWKIIQDNANEHTPFKDGVVSITGANPKDIDKLSDLKDHFSLLFGVGISKWLVKLMVSGTPPCIVTISRGHCYRIKSKSPNMLSLCFLMIPIATPRVDPAGIVNEQIQDDTTNDDYITSVLEVIEKFKNLGDIDIMMRNNKTLFDEMVQSTISLLEQARYDTTNYRKWVEEIMPNSLLPS